jgi:hypothetical protein
MIIYLYIINQPHKDSISGKRKKEDSKPSGSLENIKQLEKDEKNISDRIIIVKLGDKDFASLINKLSE